MYSMFFVSSLANAHDYYFAFAEVEYDELNGKIEATITLTTHDFEKSLREKGNPIFLSKAIDDSVQFNLVKQHLLKGFSVSLDSQEVSFQLDGIEVMLNGATNFYISSTVPTSSSKDLEIYFGLLMDTFPEQQNKATLLYRGGKTIHIFLPQLKSQKIILSNNE